MLRSAAILLLLSLTGCFTMQLWELPTEPSERISKWEATAIDARLYHGPEGAALFVSLHREDLPPVVLALHPHPDLAERFRYVVGDDPRTRRTLRIRHVHPSHPRGHEWWNIILSARPTNGDREASVDLEFLPLPIETPAPVGSTIQLESVTWIDVEQTITTDTIGIAWRVAVTPFAVAGDLVLAIPVYLPLAILSIWVPKG